MKTADLFGLIYLNFTYIYYIKIHKAALKLYQCTARITSLGKKIKWVNLTYSVIKSLLARAKSLLEISYFTEGWGVKIQMLHCLYQNSLFCLPFSPDIRFILICL